MPEKCRLYVYPELILNSGKIVSTKRERGRSQTRRLFVKCSATNLQWFGLASRLLRLGGEVSRVSIVITPVFFT